MMEAVLDDLQPVQRLVLCSIVSFVAALGLAGVSAVVETAVYQVRMQLLHAACKGGNCSDCSRMQHSMLARPMGSLVVCMPDACSSEAKLLLACNHATAVPGRVCPTCDSTRASEEHCQPL